MRHQRRRKNPTAEVICAAAFNAVVAEMQEVGRLDMVRFLRSQRAWALALLKKSYGTAPKAGRPQTADATKAAIQELSAKLLSVVTDLSE